MCMPVECMSPGAECLLFTSVCVCGIATLCGELMAPIMCQFLCLQPVWSIGIYCVEKHECEPVGSVNRT